MINALNTAATGMNAQSKQVEVISNNIANADTVGFKKSRAEFQDLLYQTTKEPGAATSATTQNPTGVQTGLGVKLGATSREHLMGSFRGTGRALDLAVGGNGFFAVQLPGGEMAYTRDGSFNLDAEGRITTSQGYPLVPEITVPPTAQNITVALDGRVSAHVGTGMQDLGQIQLTNFANPAGLAARGGNLYGVSPGSGAAVPGTPGEEGFGGVQSQFLESSNVSPVTEMTDLVRAQRVYEMNSKVISTADQMLSTLGSVK
jgi:flagellar basal-body rod protein FlgG